ncbi:hypothetical protein D9M72_578600 [compost metagenome]
MAQLIGQRLAALDLRGQVLGRHAACRRIHRPFHAVRASDQLPRIAKLVEHRRREAIGGEVLFDHVLQRAGPTLERTPHVSLAPAVGRIGHAAKFADLVDRAAGVEGT